MVDLVGQPIHLDFMLLPLVANDLADASRSAAIFQFSNAVMLSLICFCVRYLDSASRVCRSCSSTFAGVITD